MKTAPIVRETLAVADPKRCAAAFRLMLALEKGYGSEIVPISDGYMVVADDGQAFVFTKPDAATPGD